MTSRPFRIICGVGAVAFVAGFYLFKSASQADSSVIAECCPGTFYNETACSLNVSQANRDQFCNSAQNKQAILSFAALMSMIGAIGLASTAIAVRKCFKRCRDGDAQESPIEPPVRQVHLLYGTNPDQEL